MTAAMNSIFCATRLFLPLGSAFGPETRLFLLKTPPPFPSGAPLDAAGAEFPPVGASLAVPGAALRRAGVPPFGAGAEFRRAGAALHGAGAAVRRSGVAPISSSGAPAARSDAPMAQSGHPGRMTGRLGDRERRRFCVSKSPLLPLSESEFPGEAVLPVSSTPHLQVFCL